MPVSDSGVPFELRTPEFLEAWKDWTAYRREGKLKAYTPTGLKGTYAKLARMGPQTAVTAIRESIAETGRDIRAQNPGVRRKGEPPPAPRPYRRGAPPRLVIYGNHHHP